MIMNNEFKRLQELAGIKEITVKSPLPKYPKYDDLKVGDRIQATKDHPPYVMSGDIWEVERIGDLGLLNFIQGQGKARTMNGGSFIQRMLDYVAFKYA
jgi:hypothetical protein